MEPEWTYFFGAKQNVTTTLPTTKSWYQMPGKICKLGYLLFEKIVPALNKNLANFSLDFI